MKYILIFSILLNLLMSSVFAQGDAKKYEFFKEQKTAVKNPFELRDPFRRKINRSQIRKKRKYGLLDGNYFSNLPSIDEVPIAKIKVTGVLLGPNRRAMAKVDGINGHTFVLKEGMKLGVDDAEIKAILPGGVVLVEKIRNVYDQDEYLETILPISNSDASGKP